MGPIEAVEKELSEEVDFLSRSYVGNERHYAKIEKLTRWRDTLRAVIKKEKKHQRCESTEWRDAIMDRATINGAKVTEGMSTREVLNAVIAMEIQLANDPAVSKEAADRQNALEQVCEALTMWLHGEHPFGHGPESHPPCLCSNCLHGRQALAAAASFRQKLDGSLMRQEKKFECSDGQANLCPCFRECKAESIEECITTLQQAIFSKEKDNAS